MADTVGPDGIDSEAFGDAVGISGAPARYDVSGTGYLGGEYPGGTTTVAGVPTSAQVQVLHELPTGDWQLVDSVTSGADGTWQVTGLNHELEFHVVGRLGGFNDTLQANVRPIDTLNIYTSGAFEHNLHYDGLDGALVVVGGFPPYSVESVASLPDGLSFEITGHILSVGGRSDDVGFFSSSAQITSANGIFKSVAVDGEIRERAFGLRVADLSPLIWLRFNELSGSVAGDSSGNGYSCPIGGSFALGADSLVRTEPDDGALGLTGGYVTVDLPHAVMPIVDMTFIITIKGDDFSGTYGRCIFHRGDSGATYGQGAQFNVSNTGRLRVDWFSSYWDNVVDSGTVILVGVSYVVGLRISGKAVTFFVNGLPSSTKTMKSSFPATSLPLHIGSAWSLRAPVQPWKGVLDDFIAFGRPLSDEEVFVLCSPAA